MRSVFYCDNGGAHRVEYLAAFLRVASLFELSTSAYSNLTARTRRSSLDQEIRQDFYAAESVVVLFGEEPRDSWVLPELDALAAQSPRKTVHVFATSELKKERFDLEASATMVTNPNEFAATLGGLLR